MEANIDGFGYVHVLKPRVWVWEDGLLCLLTRGYLEELFGLIFWILSYVRGVYGAGGGMFGIRRVLGLLADCVNLGFWCRLVSFWITKAM